MGDIYVRPGDELWYPTNNDLSPTAPEPGDYDISSWAEDAFAAAEQHVALMGGWCATHPDRTEDGPVVRVYEGGDDRLRAALVQVAEQAVPGDPSLNLPCRWCSARDRPHWERCPSAIARKALEDEDRDE